MKITYLCCKVWMSCRMERRALSPEIKCSRWSRSVLRRSVVRNVTGIRFSCFGKPLYRRFWPWISTSSPRSIVELYIMELPCRKCITRHFTCIGHYNGANIWSTSTHDWPPVLWESRRISFGLVELNRHSGLVLRLTTFCVRLDCKSSVFGGDDCHDRDSGIACNLWAQLNSCFREMDVGCAGYCFCHRHCDVGYTCSWYPCRYQYKSPYSHSSVCNGCSILLHRKLVAVWLRLQSVTARKPIQEQFVLVDFPRLCSCLFLAWTIGCNGWLPAKAAMPFMHWRLSPACGLFPSCLPLFFGGVYQL